MLKYIRWLCYVASCTVRWVEISLGIFNEVSVAHQIKMNPPLCFEESGTEGHFVLVTTSWLHWMNRNPIHAVALSALTPKRGTKVSSFPGHASTSTLSRLYPILQQLGDPNSQTADLIWMTYSHSHSSYSSWHNPSIFTRFSVHWVTTSILYFFPLESKKI